MENKKFGGGDRGMAKETDTWNVAISNRQGHGNTPGYAREMDTRIGVSRELKERAYKQLYELQDKFSQQLYITARGLFAGDVETFEGLIIEGIPPESDLGKYLAKQPSSTE